MSTSERSETASAVAEPVVVRAETPAAMANQRAASFVLGARKLMFDELQFTSNELMERTQTEVHLLSELMSRMAAAHSVSDIRLMYEECSKHQLEFFRRDCDRAFKHAERMIEATSDLFKGPAAALSGPMRSTSIHQEPQHQPCRTVPT